MKRCTLPAIVGILFCTLSLALGQQTPEANPDIANSNPSGRIIGPQPEQNEFRGQLMSLGRDRLTLQTVRPDGSVQPVEIVVPNDVPITVNGRNAAFTDLNNSCCVRVLAHANGNVLIADVIDAVCNTAGGGGGGGRQASAVVFGGGGGGGSGGTNIFPPGTNPPVIVPPVTTPPVAVPPVTVPPVTVPPVVIPPVTIPPVVIPPITVPPVTLPPITLPPVNVPPVVVPPINIPTVNLPPINIPSINLPPVSGPPSISIPPVVIPPITIPSIPPTVPGGPIVSIPNIIPPVTLPDISVPSLPDVKIPSLPDIKLPDINLPPGGHAPCADTLCAILHITLEELITKLPELKTEIHNQIDTAHDLTVDLLNKTDGKIDLVADIVAIKISHLCNVLEATIDTVKSTPDDAHQKLVVTLREVVSVLRQCDNNGQPIPLSVLTELHAKLEVALRAATACVGDPSDTVNTAILQLKGSLQLTTEAVGGLISATGDKVIDAKIAVVRHLLGMGTDCGCLTSALVAQIDSTKGLTAHALRHLANVLAATIDKTTDQAAAAKLRLITSLRSCADSLEIATVAIGEKAKDALLTVSVNLGAVADAAKGILHGDGGDAGGAASLLIIKLQLAADAAKDLVSGTADKVVSAQLRLVQALSDISGSCGLLAIDLQAELTHIKATVASLLNGEIRLTPDLRAQLIRLIEADVDLDVVTARRLADALLVSGVLDASAVARLCHLLLVDVDTNLLADASLARQLLIDGKLDATGVARLANLVFVRADLSADVKATLANLLRGDVGRIVTLSADLRGQLLARLLHDVDLRIDPNLRVARLLRVVAHVLHLSIGHSDDKLDAIKAELVVKLHLAANAAEDLVIAAKLKVGQTLADKEAVVAAAVVKLTAALNSVGDTCNLLEGVAGKVNGIELKLGLAVRAVVTATLNVLDATGDKVEVAKAVLAAALQGCLTPSDNLIVQLTGTIGDAKHQLAVKLQTAAYLLSHTVDGTGDKLVSVKALAIAKLTAAAQAAERLAILSRILVGRTDDTARAILAAAHFKLTYLLGDAGSACGLLTELTHGSVDSLQAKLAVVLLQVGGIKHSLLDVIGDKKQIILTKLDRVTDDVGFLVGIALFTTHEKLALLEAGLAGKLDLLADVLEGKVTDVKSKLGQAQLKIIAELRIAAACARDLLVALESPTGDAIAIAHVKLVKALEVAASACDLAGSLQGKLDTLEVKLGGLLHAASAKVNGLTGDLSGTVVAVKAKVLASLNGCLPAVNGLIVDLKLQVGDVQSTLAVKLRVAADLIAGTINGSEQKVIAIKELAILKLRLAADAAEDVALKVKVVLGSTEATAREALVDAQAKLIATLQDASVACLQLSDVTHGAVSLLHSHLATTLQCACVTLTGLKDVLAVDVQSIRTHLDETAFVVGSILFVLHDKVATVELQLANHLDHLADVLEGKIVDVKSTLGQTQTLLVLKLRAAADAAHDLVAALKAHIGDGTGDVIVAAQQKLALALGDAGQACEKLTVLIKAAVDSPEAKLDQALTLASGAVHAVIGASGDKVVLLKAELNQALQGCLPLSTDLVVALLGKAGDAKSELALKLRAAASLIGATLDSTKDKLGATKALVIAKLLHAADCADDVAVLVKSLSHETLGDVHGKLIQATITLARALDDAGCACELLPAILGNAPGVLHTKLGETLRVAAALLLHLQSPIGGKLDHTVATINGLLSHSHDEVGTLLALIKHGDHDLPGVGNLANLDIDARAQLATILRDTKAVLSADARAKLLRVLSVDTSLDAKLRATLARTISLSGQLDATARATLVKVIDGQVAAHVPSFEVLLHGPIHEAFLQPFEANLVDGLIVQLTPPDPIKEIAPNIGVAGTDLKFIPGYWGYDVGAKAFVWVSGTLRHVPPGRQWLAGGWLKVDKGFQWLPGAWVPIGFDPTANQIPTPPAIKNLLPTTAAPAIGHIRNPGRWVFQNGQFTWKAPSWIPGNANWIWNPPQLLKTPTGLTVVSGFWDFPLQDRGQLFAPIRFDNPSNIVKGFTFTPGVVTHTSRIMLHLFVQKGMHHYLFGNYHGNQFAGLNIQPWFTQLAGGRGFDPVLEFYVQQLAGRKIDLVARLDAWSRYFQNNPAAAPPRTVAQFVALVQGNAQVPQALILVSNVDEVFGTNATKQLTTTAIGQTVPSIVSNSLVPTGGVLPAIPGSSTLNGSLLRTNLPAVNSLGGSLPGAIPGAILPGGLSGGSLISVLPGGSLPGALPGGSLPGALPGALPAGSLPGGLPGALPGGGLPGALPGALPGGSLPGALPGGSLPGALPGGSLPGGLPGALPGALPGGLPGALPGGSLPGALPGALPGGLSGALPGGSLPGALPGGVTGGLTGAVPRGR